MDQKIVRILRESLRTHESSSGGNTGRDDNLWEKAGLFGTRLLKEVNKTFKIKGALYQLQRERNGQRKNTEINWDVLMENIKKYFKYFVDDTNEGNVDVYKALKQKISSLEKVRCYTNEGLHAAIDEEEFTKDTKGEIYAVQAVSDGRCFYDAVAMNLLKEKSNGKNLPNLLKILLAQDIFTNEDTYATIFDKLSAKKVISKEEMILMILSYNCWADAFIIECMALYLGRTIYLYQRYADVKGEKFKTDSKYNGEQSSKKPIAIAYVGATDSCEMCNHFIALLKIKENGELPLLVLPEKSDNPIVLD